MSVERSSGGTRDHSPLSPPEWAQQGDYDVRFEWGPLGVDVVPADHVVVVDVLRFTTAVEAAVTNGALVYPYRWKDDSAADFAATVGAQLARGEDPVGPTLSPVRLRKTLLAADRIVLPSPNGSTCAAIASERGSVVIAGCLRNAAAVAAWLNGRAGTTTVIACGERWRDGSLRPSLEDYLGAGAIVTHLIGTRSPEAEAASALWKARKKDITAVIAECASGRELQARGWRDDLAYACQVDSGTVVPVLRDGAFTAPTTR